MFKKKQSAKIVIHVFNMDGYKPSEFLLKIAETIKIIQKENPNIEVEVICK